MLVKYLLVLGILSTALSLKTVSNVYDLTTRVQNSEWSFLKVYSKDCGYCKEIQPVCIDLQKTYKDVAFFEMVGTEQRELTTRLKISVFPTLFLFHKHLDLPITHHGPRDKENLEGWIKYITSFQLPKISELKDTPDAIYRGPKGKEADLVKLLALRNIHTIFGWEESDEAPVLSIHGNNFTKFTQDLELDVLRATASFSNFSEAAWYNIHVKKMKGIVLVNAKETREFNNLFDAEAKKNPDIVFTSIEPHDESYLQVLEYLSATNDQGVYAILPARSGLYKLDKPINSQNLQQFITGVKDENLVVHKKSQKSNNPYILTRDNQHLVQQLPKDVVLILYDDRKPYADKLLQVANYVIAYLRFNPNIHVFICNPLKNDLTLQVPVDPLPMIIFFKNNMKEHHIYFPYNQINPQNVIQFVQENTTFDWVDPEEYGTADDSQQNQREKQTQNPLDTQL